MKSIVICPTVLALLGAATCGAVRAQDLPPRKPGLWQIDMAMPAAPGPQQMRMCIDSDTDAEMYKMGMNSARGTCDKPIVKRNGSTVTIDSVCKMGETRMTTHAVTRFTADTAYRTEADTRMEPPMPGRGEMKITQDGKWVGPCPADMTPGDVTMGSGAKMNVKQMLGGKQ
jgi:Protein of unknown function (DUF3617)